MELLLRDGDYVPDGAGGLRTAEGDEALLQRVLWKLAVRRGSFPFLPGLGSRLHELPREKPGARRAAARQYAAEALADEPGLTVRDARVSAGEDGAMMVTVELEYAGSVLTGSVSVQG